MKYSEFFSKSKLKVNGAIINAPLEIEKEFTKIRYTNTFGTEKSNCTLLFLNHTNDFERLIQTVLQNIESDSLFWICYPKGTSKVKTDLNRDIIWKLMEPYNLRPVTMVSIDSTWSAMRFRPVEKVKSSK